MSERFLARFNLQAGSIPLRDMFNAKEQRGLDHIDAVQAQARLCNALSRALRWDAQAKMGMPMDHFPRTVRLTVMIEPIDEDDAECEIEFGEAATAS